MLAEFRAGADAEEIDAFLNAFDHHSEFYRDNYFNVIERLAERRIPALRTTAWDNGYSIVTSYDMVRKVTDRPDLFTNEFGYRVVPKTVMPLMAPTDLDGEVHARMRKALNPWFSPANILRYRETVLADIERIMVDLRQRGEWDWAADFAQPVTARVTMRLLGLPEEEWSEYALPIHNAAFCIGSVESRIEGASQFGRKVHEEVARLAQDPEGPGLICHLARTDFDGYRFSTEDIERCVLNIIIGGLDTTQATFSCAAVYLGRNPDRRQELRDNPDLARTATLEFLRVFASAPMTGRYNAEDVEIDGFRFPKGEATLIFWPAANFDPAFLGAATEMDFTRSGARSVTFAAGPHRCLGQHLSRMELEAMIGTLANSDYELVESGVEPAGNISAALAYLHVPVRSKQ